MIKNEITLVKEIQQGNYNAFTHIFETYYARIYTFLLIKSNWNKFDAEETTTTTFIKAFENIKNFSTNNDKSSFTARLYKIAYHSFLDMKKCKKNPCENSVNDECDTISQDYISYFQKHIQAEQILTYLEEIWSDKKDLFILRIWNNLKYEEIAQILWKRSSTCRKDFSKLIKKIANHFKYRIDD